MELKHVLYMVYATLSYPLSLQAHAQQACSPNYQVDYTACKQTDKVVGLQTETSTSRVATKRCDPNDAQLCEVAKGALVPGVSPADIRILQPYHKDAVGTFCGPLNNVRAEVDVYCKFEYKKPQYQMVSDPSCPVASVTDAANCFAENKPTVDLSSDVVNNCLSMRPTSEAEAWIKSTCLMDVLKAANDFRLKDLTSDQYKRVQTQLTVLQSRPSTPAVLSSKIQSQISK